tara:strand:+ start:1929 stop:3338 length:1410 start_codon:yes stop_codon:yes gene_type:complete
MENFRKGSFERGTLYLLFAQGIFFLSNYVIHILAANTVSAADFGRFGVIMGILGMSYVFLSIGLPESATKYISEGRDQRTVVRLVLFFQILLSLLISLILYISAPSISLFLNDMGLIPYIRLLSILIPIRAIFNVYRCAFNGLGLFRLSSYLSLINSISKLSFSIFFLFIGYKVTGVLWGYIGSAIVVMLIGICFSIHHGFKKGKEINLGELFRFASPLIILTIILNVILDIDIILIKALISDSNQVGYYNSAKAISSVPVGLALAFSSTVLPTISKYKSMKKHSEINTFITKLISYVIILFLPFSVIISSSSDLVVSILFPSEYRESIESLSILVFSFSILAVFMILSSIFNGLGKTYFPLLVSFFMMFFYIILSYKMILSLGIFGASLASLLSNSLGVFCLLLILKAHYPFKLISQENLFFVIPNVIFYLSIIFLDPSPFIHSVILLLFSIIYINIIIKSGLFQYSI